MLPLLFLIACDRPRDLPPVAPTTSTTTEAVAPRCGDGLPSDAEACDDGNPWGGDGCTPDCAVEAGPFEQEPNDGVETATAATDTCFAALPAGDIDCYALAVPACAAISAALTGDCTADAQLTLFDPTGLPVASAVGGPGVCPVLDPERAPGARYAAEGGWTVCASTWNGGTIPAYAITTTVTPDAGFPLAPSEDGDGDGLPASCDTDRDGDGVEDDADNCPDAPNGPTMPPLVPSASGFLQDWLALAPITGTNSPDACAPSLNALPGGDANAAPQIGDPAFGLVWTAALGAPEIFDFLPAWGFVGAPREIYLHTWVYSATARPLTLAIGADDGVRVWWNQAEVLDIAGCQGVWPDQFQAAVTVPAGWSPLTVKVRDQGGGWGASVRFLDAGAPVTDLELSLTDGPWLDDQSDGDGDGVGDACDPTP